MSYSESVKKYITFVAVNVLIACGLIVVTEVLGQFGFLLRHGRLLFQEKVDASEHEPLFEVHPYLVGRPISDVSTESNGVTITTTSSHTRWTGARGDPGVLLRIAILGGSTAFGTRVTDEDTWAAILQRKLGDRFYVRNYGVPGYSTAEGIIQMALIVPEFQPHFVIVFEGWNDIRNYHDPDMSPDYYGHGMSQFGNLGLVPSQNTYLLDGIARRSAILRFARAVRNRLTVDPPTEMSEGSSARDASVDRIYARNLRTIALLAEHSGSRALFVPQVLNYSYYRHSHGCDPWTPHIKNESMPELMNSFNHLMKSVCVDGELGCVFVQDVLAADWTPADFVDSGHFSKGGGEKFSDILSRVILSEV